MPVPGAWNMLVVLCLLACIAALGDVRVQCVYV